MRILIFLEKCLFLLVLFCVWSCKLDTKNGNNDSIIKAPDGMIWVPKKTFTMGAKANDAYALEKEMPTQQVTVDGFFIDATEVTNKQFRAFVEATGYVTIAERPINWEEMKNSLPAGTPKPPDSILQPGCLIFNRNVKKISSFDDISQWWSWKLGANWKHPNGPESSIEGKDNYPVVHVAYEDALAYCKWANRLLPTEAQWESAAQGTAKDNIYTWGNDKEQLDKFANTWQGNFPISNKTIDGFDYAAPVKSYPPNSIGIYDMLGNVWEITADFFDVAYYKNRKANDLINPKGADKTYNPDNLYEQQMVIKGGSFLCNASYCASYRISAKMPMSLSSSTDHTGFRTVATPNMLKKVD